MFPSAFTGIVYYHVLKPTNTLLDISGHSYGQNLPKMKEIRLV